MKTYFLASSTSEGPCMGDLVREGKADKYYTHDSYGEVDGWEWTNYSGEDILVRFTRDGRTFVLKNGQCTADIF